MAFRKIPFLIHAARFPALFLVVILIVYVIIYEQTLDRFIYDTSDENDILRIYATPTSPSPTPTPTITNSNNIHFTTTLHNNTTNTTVTCNPYHFKYIQRLLDDIHRYHIVKKWHSNEFDDTVAKQHFCINTKKGLNAKAVVRFKSFNGSLYYDSNITQYLVGYSGVIGNYLRHLLKKYGSQVPNIDFMVLTNDLPAKGYIFDWNYFPCFIVKGAHDTEHTNVALHMIATSVLRDFFRPHIRDDYMLASYNDSMHTFENHYQRVQFKDKINKAVFRGSPFVGTNNLRDRVVFYVNNNMSAHAQQYFDAKFIDQHKIRKTQGNMRLCGNGTKKEHHCWVERKETMSVVNELNYKYVIVIDGLTTRDAMARQMRYNSVMFKENSIKREFWYYDLIEGEHLFLFDNETHLVDLMNELQMESNETLSKIANNAYLYSKSHLFDENALDCFTINMFDIYNHFFYDSMSLNITETDTVLFNYKQI